MRFHNMSGGNVQKSIRKLVRQIGEQATYLLMDLSEADSKATLTGPLNSLIDYMKEMREEVRKVLDSPIKVKRSSVLTGDQIMFILGIQPSPLVGKVKAHLIDLEDDLAVDGRTLSVEEASKAVANFVV